MVKAREGTDIEGHLCDVRVRNNRLDVNDVSL